MTHANQAAPASRFETLDGLRGCGALGIVIAHSLLMWTNLPGRDLIGTVMIDIFFVLSGFVLAFAYEPKFGNRPSVWKFMRSRLMRLYPLYLLGALMGFVLALVIMYGESDDWMKPITQMGMALFMIPAVSDPESIYPLNFPAWTLFCELLVNLVYILVWRRLDGRMLAVFIALGAIVLVTTTLVFGRVHLGTNFAFSLVALGRAWFGFFAGVALYRFAARSRTTALPRGWSGVAIIAAAGPIFFIPINEVWLSVAEIALVCIGSPLIIFLAQRVDPPARIGRIFLWLGSISYAVYMLHWPLYIAAIRLIEKLQLTYAQVTPFAGIALLLVAMIVAMLAERYYDRPVRAWLGAMLRRRRSTPLGARPSTQPA